MRQQYYEYIDMKRSLYSHASPRDPSPTLAEEISEQILILLHVTDRKETTSYGFLIVFCNSNM